MMYSGMISTSCGSTRLPRKMRKNRSRYRNVRRENAYAESSDTTTASSAPADATRNVLSMMRANGIAVHTVA